MFVYTNRCRKPDPRMATFGERSSARFIDPETKFSGEYTRVNAMVWRSSARWIRKVARSKLLLRERNRFRVLVAKCQDLDGDAGWLAYSFGIWFSVIYGWGTTGVECQFKKNIPHHLDTHACCPGSRNHRYEIRILVFIHVLLDELLDAR